MVTSQAVISGGQPGRNQSSGDADPGAGGTGSAPAGRPGPAGTTAAATGPAPITMAKALNLGLHAAMAADPKVIVMGEDVGKLGGVFRVTDGLQSEFGEARVIDTPLAESAIVGTAIGLAMRGYRPVCEIQFDGFVYPAFDQIVSQLAKLHYRSAGRIRLPVTIRIPFGGGIGAVAPQRVSRGLLLPHRGPEGRGLLESRGRERHDPAGRPLGRPGDLPGAQAAVLGEGGGGRAPAH